MVQSIWTFLWITGVCSEEEDGHEGDPAGSVGGCDAAGPPGGREGRLATGGTPQGAESAGEDVRRGSGPAAHPPGGEVRKTQGVDQTGGEL